MKKCWSAVKLRKQVVFKILWWFCLELPQICKKESWMQKVLENCERFQRGASALWSCYVCTRVSSSIQFGCSTCILLKAEIEFHVQCIGRIMSLVKHIQLKLNLLAGLASWLAPDGMGYWSWNTYTPCWR